MSTHVPDTKSQLLIFSSYSLFSLWTIFASQAFNPKSSIFSVVAQFSSSPRSQFLIAAPSSHYLSSSVLSSLKVLISTFSHKPITKLPFWSYIIINNLMALFCFCFCFLVFLEKPPTSCCHFEEVCSLSCGCKKKKKNRPPMWPSPNSAYTLTLLGISHKMGSIHRPHKWRQLYLLFKPGGN